MVHSTATNTYKGLLPTLSSGDTAPQAQRLSNCNRARVFYIIQQMERIKGMVDWFVMAFQRQLHNALDLTAPGAVLCGHGILCSSTSMTRGCVAFHGDGSCCT